MPNKSVLFSDVNKVENLLEKIECFVLPDVLYTRLNTFLTSQTYIWCSSNVRETNWWLIDLCRPPLDTYVIASRFLFIYVGSSIPMVQLLSIRPRVQRFNSPQSYSQRGISKPFQSLFG
jgi:hypothetical protein